MRKTLIFLILGLMSIPMSIFCESNILLESTKKELQRAMSELKKEKIPPYFISYYIKDELSTKIVASNGKIKANDASHTRSLDIDLRVGSYDFDNTHIIRGNVFDFSASRNTIDLPLENEEKAIRAAIWISTDNVYKNSIERWEKVVTNKAVKVKEEDSSADFSIEKPVKHIDNKIILEFDKKQWQDRIRQLSDLFTKETWLFDASVALIVELSNKTIVNSEGTEIVLYEPSARISINAKTKAEDGMTLPLYKSYFAFSPKDLPDDKTISEDIKYLIKLLAELKEAPLMTTYTGPAMLSGEAAGVFFHEIFGHRVEGHRQKDPNSSQTFKSYINQKVLPEFIDVDFNPTIDKLKGFELSGYYKYDDEGVLAQNIKTVESGIFKNFIMSRSPIENFPNSNGHGRKAAGYQVVSRQSNLIVSSKQTTTFDNLKNRLRDEAKKDGKEFGLYFVKVQGGFTFTGRTVPNSFNVLPLIVYKVFVDGRPDELVRGVDLIGTPLTTFSNIIGSADDIGVFNGICGAESGGVPVSACSPSLLVSRIEVQKKSKSQAKPPILPCPVLNSSKISN